jgi:hypothetical protein
VYTANQDDSFNNESFTFTHIVVEVGSFCVDKEYIFFHVHHIRVLQFVLKLYGIESTHTHISHVLVTLKLHGVNSLDDALLNVNDGHCLSILITAQLFTVSILPAISVE